MKNEETTARLDDMLKSVHTDKQAEQYISEHTTEDASRSFSEYLNDYVAERDLEMSTVVRRSQLNKNYVYNIINGYTKSPSRDKILALCIGAGMNKAETDRALKLSGLNPLYAKEERDVRIIICLNNGANDVLQVNLELEKHGLSPIRI